MAGATYQYGNRTFGSDLISKILLVDITISSINIKSLGCFKGAGKSRRPPPLGSHLSGGFKISVIFNKGRGRLRNLMRIFFSHVARPPLM